MYATYKLPRLLFLLMTTLVLGTLPVLAEEPEFYDRPFAPEQWKLGQRVDESQLRYCVDQRDPDWQVAAAIADTIAQALLLEPNQYMTESDIVLEDITKVYALLLEHCDIHLGFKLIPGGFSSWATLTRAYYDSQYLFVTNDPDAQSLAELAPTQRIGATMGTSAHFRLVSYLTALPAAERWPTYPMGSNDRALESLVKGSIDVALVWAPSLWAKQQEDEVYAKLRVIESHPLPETGLGVGALMLAKETFLRTAIDQAIAALIADGTITRILESFQFPAVARH